MRNGWLSGGISLLAAAAVITNLGCGGGSIVASPTPPPPPPSNGIAVTLTQTALAIDANQSDSLTATVSNDPKNGGVNWTLTCPSSVSACGGMGKASTASGVATAYAAPTPVGGAENVTVTATSVSDPTRFASVQVTVNPAPTLINPPPAQTGNVGQNYSLDLSQYVQGGTLPFTWSVKSGTLPAGLSVDHTGLVNGMPTTVASSMAVLIRADSGNPPTGVTVSLWITIGPPVPLTLLPGSEALPNGKVGARYNPHHLCANPFLSYCRPIVYGALLSAHGGVQPYVWSCAAAPGSALPPGLTLSGGLIDGAPTAAGTYTFTVTVTDSASSPVRVSATYTIVVQ